MRESGVLLTVMWVEFQQRLLFPSPTERVKFTMALAGLRVLVEVSEGTPSQGWAHLASVGVDVSHEDASSSFAIRQLVLCHRLPAYVSVDIDHLLRPLWMYAKARDTNEPARVEIVVGDLRMAWLHASVLYDEIVHVEAIPALLACDLPFVASGNAWDALAGMSTIPVSVGRIKISPMGYFEITSSKPQLVESSPIPALFKIAETRYGVPFAYEYEALAAPGFIHDSAPLTQSPIDESFFESLSPSSAATAREIAESLALSRAACLIAPPGSSRRVAVCAALQATDSIPALVITPPWGMWAWRRAAQLAGLDASVHSEQVRLLTYRDLALGAKVQDAAAVVFDDMGIVTSELRAATRRLDGMDAVRVNVGISWPSEESEQLFVMSRIRPSEFSDTTPTALRYPAAPARRFFEHIRPYLVRSGTTPNRISNLAVETHALPQELLAALEQSRGSIEKVTEVVSSGTASYISPKLAATLSHCQRSMSDGKSVVVLSSSPAALKRLSQMLVPERLEVQDGSVMSKVERTALILFSDHIPDLSSIDEVVLLDWPLSTSLLDRALPPPHVPTPRVTVQHMRDTVDDRLAVRALRAKDPTALTAGEIEWATPKS